MPCSRSATYPQSHKASSLVKSPQQEDPLVIALQYSLKIIDIRENPQLAEEDGVLATPTLVKNLPPPIQRILGELSEREKALAGVRLMQLE